jgi:hypothetical protein
MGWRGKDGTEHLRGEPNPKQWEMYAKNNCVFQYHMPEDQQYMRNWNRLTWTSPRTRAGASATTRCSWRCTRTRCSLPAGRAGQDKGRQPPEHLRERIATYFDPLPFWYAPLEKPAPT